MIQALPSFLALEITASWALGARVSGLRVRAPYPQTVYELRHNVLEDMKIQCRAAELKANSQSLALRR